jgi:hypothetical protein
MKKKKNEKGKKVCIFPKDLPNTLKFLVNDYPYYLHEEIEHHLIWANYNLTTEEIEAVLEKERKSYECVYFVNDEHLKSIPEVFHCHVLSRKKIN